MKTNARDGDAKLLKPCPSQIMPVDSA